MSTGVSHPCWTARLGAASLCAFVFALGCSGSASVSTPDPVPVDLTVLAEVDAGSDAEEDAGIDAAGTATSHEGCLVDLTAGDAHACAIRSDGTLWCWGADLTSEYLPGGYWHGNGSPIPLQVAGLARPVVKVAIQREDICALTDDGAVWCWGVHMPSMTIPVRVVGLPGPVKDMALLYEGRVEALFNDGSVSLWPWMGQSGDPIVYGLHAVQLTACYGNECALSDDQSLWCRGLNGYGVLGNDAPDLVDVPTQLSVPDHRIAAFGIGYDEICRVYDDGTVWCSGRSNMTGQPRPGPEQTTGLPGRARSIGVGSVQSCALGDTGWVSCWGNPGQMYEQSDPRVHHGVFYHPTVVANSAEQVVAGETFFCLGREKRFWCFGENQAGQLGNGIVSDWEDLTTHSLPVAIPCP